MHPNSTFIQAPHVTTRYSRGDRYLQLLVDKETSHTLTSTNAHTSQKNLLLLSPALTQPSDNLSSASSTKRMTKRNRTTPNVHLGMINVERI